MGGQVLDTLRADMGQKIVNLTKNLEQRLGLADQPDPDNFKAASKQEIIALESRLYDKMQSNTSQAVSQLNDEYKRDVGGLTQRCEEDKREIAGLGIETQKLKIQLQLESQQRQSLEKTHSDWLTQ